MSTSTLIPSLGAPAAAAAAGAPAAPNPLGAPNSDGAAGGPLAPAPPGAVAGHGASSGPAPKVVSFDLEDLTRSSIGMTKRAWIHTMIWNTDLLALSPRRTMAAMVAFRRTEQRTLASALSDLGHGALKNLCVHLGLEVPPKGSSGVAAKCASTILASVEHHAGVYPALEIPIEGEDVDGGSGAEVDEDDAHASSEEEEAKTSLSPPRLATKSVPVSPGRTSNRDHTKTNSKIKSSLAKESAAQSSLGGGSALGGHDAPLSSSLRNADALRAFSSLPAGPASKSDDRRRRDVKSKKKKKHHRRVAFSSDSDDDSDSDGRGSKKRRHGKKSKRSDTESSSSEDTASSSSSSSSDSDSSSSDSDSSRRKRKSKSKRHRSSKREREDIIDDMETSGLARPLADKFIRNALSGRGKRDSLFDVFKEATFKQSRNQREVLALARILDALRVKNYSAARELVVRRLVGVQTSDTSGNWKMCDAFELVMDRQSYLPDEFLARAIKNVNRMEALEAGTKRGSSAATGSSSSSNSSSRSKASTYGRGSTGGGSSHTRDRSTDSSRGSKDAPASSSSSSASKGKSSSTGSRGSK